MFLTDSDNCQFMKDSDRPRLKLGCNYSSLRFCFLCKWFKAVLDQACGSLMGKPKLKAVQVTVGSSKVQKQTQGQLKIL